jgi:hypothetical protein
MVPAKKMVARKAVMSIERSGPSSKTSRLPKLAQYMQVYVTNRDNMPNVLAGGLNCRHKSVT